MTLLLPAQITLSRVGVKWKLNRFSREPFTNPHHKYGVNIKRIRDGKVLFPRQTKMRNKCKDSIFWETKIIEHFVTTGYPNLPSFSNNALIIIVPVGQ